MLRNEAEERRSGILQCLAQAEDPLTGTELAKKFGVSRQIIVQDIAILRASGNKVFASPQGYLLLGNETQKCQRTFAVKHDQQRMETELLTMVDSGGKILDVLVEHPLYGEIKGLLMLRGREDVLAFVKNLAESGAKPLSILTEGVHLHTVEADTEFILDRIEEKLKKEGILLDNI